MTPRSTIVKIVIQATVCIIKWNSRLTTPRGTTARTVVPATVSFMKWNSTR